MQLKVLSVNISEKKGTIKKPCSLIKLNEKGVEGDAHSGSWHRQVSLLAQESIDKFSEEANRQIAYGEFAENITTEGALLYEMRPFDLLYNDAVRLEVTQIGKKCHGSNCNIFKEVGNCVMPKEGIFARVLSGGGLSPGDTLTYQPNIFKVTLVTLSDRAASGEYEDKSGPLLKELISDFFDSKKYPVEIKQVVIPDDNEQLESVLEQAITELNDLVISTGGTGIGPRDIAPEVFIKVAEKEIPGIIDMIRIKYGSDVPAALLSRSFAGVNKQTALFAIPGSPKAVKEYASEILKSLMHIYYMLHGIDSHK